MLSKKWAVMFAVLIIASLVLAACPAPATPEVVERVVKETVVVEKEVQQTVVVEKEVEKIVEVTPTPDVSQEKVTLNVNLNTEPPTLDPALATDTTSIDVLRNLMIGLTQLTPDGQVLPMLATEWSNSEDGLEWTFTMRQDAQWVKYHTATGETEVMRPVTAQDVVYGVKRTLDPRTGSSYAYVLYVIKGGEALNTADMDALSEEEAQALLDGLGVEAVDDYTVKFTLEFPAGYFPAVASMWVARPMPQEAIDEYGDRWIEPNFIWTNGPMVLVEWAHDDLLVMEKNPNWWGAGDVEIDRIEGVMVVEASTAMAMYETGELDRTAPPLEDMDRVKADPVLSQQLVIAPRDCTYYYGFTTDKPPMDNLLVRKALSAAIDRQGLIDNVTKGNQLPANTFAPSMIFGNAASNPEIAPWALPESAGGTGYAAAVEQAKAWLAEAGYPDGEGFPTLTLMHNTSEGHAKIAQAIAAMWTDALGIDVKIENQEWAVYLDTIDQATPVEEMPHVWRLGWCADYPDNNNWVKEVFAPIGGSNYARLDVETNELAAKFQDILDTAQKSQDPAERKDLYFQAEKILSDEGAWFAPIYYYTTVALTQPWMTETTYGEMGGTSWFQWKLDWQAKKDALGL